MPGRESAAKDSVVVDRPSIAVLPFTQLDASADSRYFGDGVTQDIVTELSRFRELIVVSATSNFDPAVFADDPARLGRALDAR